METRHETPGRSGGRQGAGLGETAKETASELTGAAKDVAVTRAQGLFDGNKRAAAEQIGAIANALRNVSSELEGRHEPLARAARRAADTVERFSHTIEERDLSQAFDVAQDYARRQPAVFFGGAFLLGLAAARFLKASGHHRGDEGRLSAGYEPARGYDPTYSAAERGVVGGPPPS